MSPVYLGEPSRRQDVHGASWNAIVVSVGVLVAVPAVDADVAVRRTDVVGRPVVVPQAGEDSARGGSDTVAPGDFEHCAVVVGVSFKHLQEHVFAVVVLPPKASLRNSVKEGACRDERPHVLRTLELYCTKI